MAIEKFASIPFSQIADIGIHMNTVGMNKAESKRKDNKV